MLGKHVIFPFSSINYMFSVNYIFLLNITYVFAIITCLGFLVSSGQIFHLSTFSDSNSFMSVGPDVMLCQTLHGASVAQR